MDARSGKLSRPPFSEERPAEPGGIVCKRGRSMLAARDQYFCSGQALSELERAGGRAQVISTDTLALSRVNSLFDDAPISLRNLSASLSGFAISHSQTIIIVQPSVRRAA